MFEVHSGLPLPPAMSAKKYPWSELEVGDHFIVEGGSSSRWTAQCAVRSRKDGRRYSVRRIKDLDTLHFRIFRVA